MESSYETLKAEEVIDIISERNRKPKLVIFDYIEGSYNWKRLHSTMGYITPCQAEKVLSEKAA